MTQISSSSEARLAVSTPAEIRSAYVGTVYYGINKNGGEEKHTIVGYCAESKKFTIIKDRNMVPKFEAFHYIDSFLRQLNAAELSKRLMASIQQIESPENKLARKFSEVLLEWCGPKELKAMNARNILEKDKSVCHSHDFCDANLAMIEACESLGIRWENDLNSNDYNSTVDKAWNLAKKNQFYKLWK